MAKKLTKKSFERLNAQVKDFIAQQGNATFNYKNVAQALGVTASISIGDIAVILEELAYNGEIVEITPGRYKSLRRTNVTTGTFVRRSNGKNSVITDDDGEQIMVAERNSMHAFNGDKVKISVAARTPGIEAEAEVIEIIEKKEQTFIGKLKVDKHFGYLLTDSKFLA
ncbi:MAG: ribonuclease R, partial [Muribaculaceae bacterium]|nr:ribonuclease R [Muribaculaceae bacterium]